MSDDRSNPPIADVAAYKRAGSPYGTTRAGFDRWDAEREKPKPVPADPRTQRPPQPITRPK